jgi:hypothetical protein
MAYVNVTPMTEEDVLKLSGSGGDWHTSYLLIYGLSMKIKQMKVLVKNQMLMQWIQQHHHQIGQGLALIFSFFFY